MEINTDVQKTTNEGTEVLADVINSVCSCCGTQFAFLVDSLCYVCYSNSEEQPNNKAKLY